MNAEADPVTQRFLNNVCHLVSTLQQSGMILLWLRPEVVKLEKPALKALYSQLVLARRQIDQLTDAIDSELEKL